MEEKQLLITIGEPLTKKQEADIITALKLGQGYFADEFTQSDAEIMVANIEADMPIIAGTSIEEELGEAKAKVITMEQERNQALEEMNQLKEKIARKEAEEITMQRAAVDLIDKVSAIEGELEEARKNFKSLTADYAQLTEDYERKCELLDVAMEAIGRLTAKL